MKTALLAAFLVPSAAFAACPPGMKAVGDDSERGYKCVRREGEAQPKLKPSSFKTGNDAAAVKSFGAAGATDKQGDQPADAGEAAKGGDAAGSENKALGAGLKPKKPSRGDAAPPSNDCPKGWIKKGEGCAPPKRN